MKKQIIALGGGGFSEEENSSLDSYILQQSEKEIPRICFVPTASNDAQGYIEKFIQAFRSLNCEPTVIALSDPSRNLKEFVQQQDIIYVGGGNTEYMLQRWRETGLDLLFRHAYERGTILAGLSAGAMCWFQYGITDQKQNGFRSIEGLGLLNGTFCPHANKGLGYFEVFEQLLLEDEVPSGYACEDNLGLHFINGKLVEIIRSQDTASGFYIEKKGKQVTVNNLT